MTEPMNEERAKGFIEKFNHLEPVLYDPALDRPEKAACRSYVHAKGYLERVEQERAGQSLPLYELMKKLELAEKAIEAADRMADHLEDDPHLNKNSFLLAYRAARAKESPLPRPGNGGGEVTCGICGNDGKTGWGCSHLKNTPMTKQQEPSTESMKIAAELWGQVTSVSDWARALDERFEAGRRDSTYHLNDCICGDCK